MTKKPSRNDPCPCGSGKKFKKCCYTKHQAGIKTAKLIQGGKSEEKVAGLMQQALKSKMEEDYTPDFFKNLPGFGALDDEKERPDRPVDEEKIIEEGTKAWEETIDLQGDAPSQGERE